MGNSDKKLSKATLSPAQLKKREEDMKRDRMYKAAGITTAVVLVISIIIALFQNVFSAKTPAATIGGKKVQPYVLNYYYYNAYNQMANNYGDYFQYFIDQEQPLKSQKYSQDQSWHDYFVDSAINSAQQAMALSEAAEAEGMTLSAENEASAQSALDEIYEYVVTENNGDIDQYLRYMFGNGMDFEEYGRIMRQGLLASQYSIKTQDNFSYTPDDLASHYNEHKNDFDVVNYRYYFFNANLTNDMTEEARAAAKTSTHSLAEIMANAVIDDDTFTSQAIANASEASKEAYSDASATTRNNASYSTVTSYISAEAADWLFDADRQSGNIGVVDTASGSYVLMLNSRTRNDYDAVNVRHILIGFALNEGESEPTDQQDMAAKSSATEIYNEWKNGEATEESFAKLASEKSNDGSAANGGLYEDVYKGQMVAEFENWCFDPARKVGDTGIVRTSYGYHIMYYSGTSSPYWEIQVDSALRTSDYTEWLDTLLEEYPVKRRALGMMSVKLQNS